MRAYIIRRLLLMIPTLFLVTIIVFGTVRFVPGNVIELMVAEMSEDAGTGVEVTAQVIRHRLGLDVPIHVQYGRWVGKALRGDLGLSLWTDQPVATELRNRLPVSFELGLLAIIIGVIIALPVGVYSAIRQDTGGDYVGRLVAILGLSIPNFWLGTMIIVYPSIWWDWSPSVQYIPLAEDPIGNLQMFIIPALVMGTAYSAAIMRMTRTMMLEVLRQDYIRTAWAKGLRERTVVIRHAMKNALIPVVTQIGMRIPVLVAGAVITEQIFCLPGIGMLLVDSISKRDYPIISGINLMVASFILIVNLLVDLTYAYLDPRVHYR